VCIMNDASLSEPTRWVMGGKGIAWGLDEHEIAHAKATVHEARSVYLKEEETFWQQLQNFVERTQAHADKLGDEGPLDVHGLQGNDVSLESTGLSVESTGATVRNNVIHHNGAGVSVGGRGVCQKNACALRQDVAT